MDETLDFLYDGLVVGLQQVEELLHGQVLNVRHSLPTQYFSTQVQYIGVCKNSSNFKTIENLSLYYVSFYYQVLTPIRI
jgi:hypothetical protein